MINTRYHERNKYTILEVCMLDIIYTLTFTNANDRREAYIMYNVCSDFE